MKSVVGFLILSFIAFAAAMPLIVPDIPVEEGDLFRILPIYRDDRNGAFTLRDPKEMAERLKNIPYETTTGKSNDDDESYFTIGPIKTDDETYPGTLRQPEEIAKRLEGIPFVTSTDSE